MMAFKNSDYASLFQFIVHQLVKKKKRQKQKSTGDYFQMEHEGKSPAHFL